ncbi:hypothetical protein Pmi06nite_60110 [Planotetraspora mira]|uniref:Uncharacterized protein n=1 Tax=Planotetraspora mira TaxID=58121 RepID=A0A8J3XA09_9ACTN|nr:hypothetical protein Pmi06nite_60110 [Planotetraspora mira]
MVWKLRLIVSKAMLTIVVSRNTTKAPRLPRISTQSARRPAVDGSGAPDAPITPDAPGAPDLSDAPRSACPAAAGSEMDIRLPIE